MPEQLREKIARLPIIARATSEEPQLHLAPESINQILSLFKEEIKKLEVIGDEEICGAIIKGINTEEVINPLDLIKDGFLSEHHRTIAQAQLKDCKDKLLEVMK